MCFKATNMKKTEYVRSILQQNYWIVGFRNAFETVKLKCVKCRKQQVGGVQPFLAELPKERLEERVFLFANTGVDYFGPFEMKFMRKSVKRWCCLFTCFTTRAAHVEFVPSLEADACLAAITRFIARRRKPNTILSDSGTNFVGAAREMREWIEAWNQSDIEQSLAQRQIKWKFNPPCALHLQVAVPKEKCIVVRLLWRDSPEHSIEIFEYNRHVFGAKSSPTCANYGFQQGGREQKLIFVQQHRS